MAKVTYDKALTALLAIDPYNVVSMEHWCSSGFANTDLDLQLKNTTCTNSLLLGS
jgi:hypothetical protein